MTRALLLAALLAAASASAQTPADSPAASPADSFATLPTDASAPLRPTRRQIARMTALGTACGLAAGIVASPTGAVLPGLVLTVAAFPAGAAACVWGEARRYGFGGRYPATFADAALGAALGAAAGYAVGGTLAFVLIEVGAGGGDEFVAVVAGGAVGLTVFAGTAAYVAARRAHRHSTPESAPVAMPAVLAIPGGEMALGVALRVPLR